jgi:hypothetical protein
MEKFQETIIKDQMFNVIVMKFIKDLQYAPFPSGREKEDGADLQHRSFREGEGEWGCRIANRTYKSATQQTQTRIRTAGNKKTDCFVQMRLAMTEKR